jgi:hypothetical protein
MIEKIIASGNSSAAVAALDVAIKLGLAYGGWCRQGDTIADRYHLDRIADASYQTIIDKAIGAAHGSLYFIHGRRSSLELEKTKKTVSRLNKPFLLLDLAQERGFSASRRIAIWIAENQIRVLHVDGATKEQQTAAIIDSVAGILEATFFLSMMETGVTSPLQSIVQQERFPQQASSPPETMEAALDRLERSLSLKDKATIANMALEELISLHFTLGDYINTHFDLFTTNTRLLADCRNCAGQKDLAPKDAAAVIIRQLWERLRDTCRIRIIK